MKYGEEMRARMFVKETDKQILNSVIGLNEEAGEVAGWFKKNLYHPDRNLPLSALRKEIGDVQWYLAVLNTIMFGDTLEDVARENIRKLKERYPDRYGTLDENDLVL